MDRFEEAGSRDPHRLVALDDAGHAVRESRVVADQITEERTRLKGDHVVPARRPRGRAARLHGRARAHSLRLGRHRPVGHAASAGADAAGM